MPDAHNRRRRSHAGVGRELCDDYIAPARPELKVSLGRDRSRTRGRGGVAPAQAVEIEGERILAAARTDEYVVALDERGKEMTTRELAPWLG